MWGTDDMRERLRCWVGTESLLGWGVAPQLEDSSVPGSRAWSSLVVEGSRLPAV